MKNIYVPYAGVEPAVVSIKGHNLLILCRDLGRFSNCLEMIGADNVKQMEIACVEDEDEHLDSLAHIVQGAVVIAPDDMEVMDLLVNLESELPWLH
ncbi:MAG: hypothetical protein KDD62_10935 [Bdellovibrionales bacterium]|nr:hypothetical protein [Bdellovibrionales bacterium]